MKNPPGIFQEGFVYKDIQIIPLQLKLGFLFSVFRKEEYFH